MSRSIEDIINLVNIEHRSAQTISDYVSALPDLCTSLTEYSLVETSTLAAALQTNMNLQGNLVIVELLQIFVLTNCNGTKKPKIENISQWLNIIQRKFGHLCDPPEDVYIELILTPKGDFRLFSGCWESNGFYTQRVIDASLRWKAADELVSSALELLKVSELCCCKANLARHVVGKQEVRQQFTKKDIKLPKSQLSAVYFSNHALEEYGISVDALSSFCLNTDEVTAFGNYIWGHSPFERFPLLRTDDGLLLLFPNNVGVAVRLFLYDHFHSIDKKAEFNECLASEYGNFFSSIPLLGNNRRQEIQFIPQGNFFSCCIMKEIDAGRFLNIVWFMDPLNDFELTGFVGMPPDPDIFINQLSYYIKKAFEDATSNSHFKSGMTLIVACGIGRAINYNFKNITDQSWRVDFISPADLNTLSMLHSFTDLELFRTYEYTDKLTELGVHMTTINGLLNHIAIKRLTSGDMIQQGSHEEKPSLVLMPTDSLRELRHSVAVSRDIHSLVNKAGDLVPVAKLTISEFQEDDQYPLYMPLETYRVGYLEIAYEGREKIWWLSIDVKNTTTAPITSRKDMMLAWWPRIVSCIERDLNPQASEVVSVVLCFENIEKKRAAIDDIAGEEEIKNSFVTEIDRDERTIRIEVGDAFDKGLSSSQNISEKALVSEIVLSLLNLLSINSEETLLQTLVENIVEGNYARQTHAFRVDSPSKIFRLSSREPVVKIISDDFALLSLGEAWNVIQEQKGQQIDGRKNCTEFLNTFVKYLENDLQKELLKFDKQSLLRLILSNYEACSADIQRWQMTSAANMAMHAEKQEAASVLLERERSASMVFSASRCLIEMASAEAPDGGVSAGRADLAILLAKAHRILQTGMWSDVIHWGFMKPNVFIRPLGAVHVDQSFYEKIIIPSTQDFAERALQENVENYDSLFQQQNDEEKPKWVEDFDSAWQAEFGLSLTDCVEFNEAISELFNQLVLTSNFCHVNKLVSLLEKSGLESEKTESIINRLTFPFVKSWRDIPDGYSPKDRFFWKFRRRLSVLRFPILALEDGPNPQICISPLLLDDAFRYMVNGFSIGAFPEAQIRSDAMRKWNGQINATRVEFNDQVSDRLRSLGWQTKSEVTFAEIYGNHSREGVKYLSKLGDVDVLAFNSKTGVVVAIECKNLHLAKTAGEICEQMSDFKGEMNSDGKPDLLLKHLNRFRYIKDNLSGLSDYLGFSPKKLRMALVFKNPVPLLHSSDLQPLGVEMYTFENLDNL